MSDRRSFMGLLLQMQAQTNATPQAYTAADLQSIEIGRIQGTNFIDALRAGEKTQDLLLCAVFLMAEANPMELRGLLRELSEFIQETAQ